MTEAELRAIQWRKVAEQLYEANRLVIHLLKDNPPPHSKESVAMASALIDAAQEFRSLKAHVEASE